MSLEARLEWRSPMAGHVDRLVINRSALQADGRWLAAGEALNRSAEVSLDPTPWCQPAGLPPIEIDLGAFRPRVELVAGRFYPRLAFGRLLGSARDTRPVRLIACDPQTKLWRIDPNHPLAADPVRMFLRQTDDAAAPGIRLAELFDGPGMQRLPDDPAATYFPTGALQREDNAADTDFYARPRLTQHLDAHCRAGIANLYGRLLQPGMRVLDLMSSIASHLPETPADLQVSGLGMNPDELSANPHLAERVVHDLNACATLPWRDDSFDCVFNTASIEYLVSRPRSSPKCGACCDPAAYSPSPSWTAGFPQGDPRLAPDSPLRAPGAGSRPAAASGLPRPAQRNPAWVRRPQDDKYSSQREFSDPLFAVWGRKP